MQDIHTSPMIWVDMLTGTRHVDRHGNHKPCFDCDKEKVELKQQILKEATERTELYWRAKFSMDRRSALEEAAQLVEAECGLTRLGHEALPCVHCTLAAKIRAQK